MPRSILKDLPKFVVAGLMMWLLATGAGFAGPFEDASRAYENGEFSVAFELYLPIANSGNPEAQYRLGMMFERGQGVEKDIGEALGWLRASAEQGFAMARFALGEIYAAGDAVPRDVSEAERWYRLAAVQGDAKSQYSIGVMYAIGVGLPRNMILAYMWFELAAALGDVNGAAARERMEFVMTDEELARGQKLARRCLASNYVDCVEAPVAAPGAA